MQLIAPSGGGDRISNMKTCTDQAFLSTGENYRIQKQPMNQRKSTLLDLLMKLETELVVTELAAWAAYYGDPLPKQDRDRTLLAIRRIEALRGAIDARVK